MQSAKHLAAITKKLSNVPELPYKKGQLMSPLSPKQKEKLGAKSVPDKIEPMVLRSPPTGESVMRYALPIPSNKTKESLAGEMVRRITKHLQTVVATLEDTYGPVTEGGEVEVTAEEQDLSLSLGNDIHSFLNCCSQFAVQLQEASKEEYNILDSLFKWFQQQVNQIEEISKDHTIVEEDLPSPDKTIHLSIAQIVRLIDRLRELRNRLKQKTKESMLRKPMDKDNLPGAVKNYEALEKKIEEFIKAHSAEHSESVPASDTDSPYSVCNRFNVMMKIFENQTNMLERALNDQRLLEAKYKQMQSDFELLSEEKFTLENEVQKLKVAENAKSTSNDDFPKKALRTEIKKESHGKRSTIGELTRPAEFLQVQEAERNKTQLDSILNQGKEPRKSEETKVEMDFSKAEVAHEDSKSMPSGRQPKTTSISNPGGQKKNEKKKKKK